MEDILLERKTGFADRFFGISQSHSSVKTEVLAGITTFITIAYILILNPQILSDPYLIMGDAAMAQKIANGVFIGTCIGAFIGTILCALYARVPFAQAPGMGLNAFFAYTVVLGMGYTYGQALVIVFISGIFFIVITAIGLREAIIRSIPDAVKTANYSGNPDRNPAWYYASFKFRYESWSEIPGFRGSIIFKDGFCRPVCRNKLCGNSVYGNDAGHQLLPGQYV